MNDPAWLDPATGKYAMSRPQGGINDPNSKLYPFKYKTAYQPFASNSMLIALSTASYFTYGIYDTAVKAGLVNMGYADTTPYTTVKTDEYQVLNHQVPTANNVLQCSACHPNATATQMKLVADHGYGLKAAKSQVCSQCHSDKRMPSYDRMHNNHVHSSRNLDCSWCHNFSRPGNGYCAPPNQCAN
ncbi:MAG: hypothetical protein MZV70_02650 [Desulfobacterales bacterium]|nr:hypothetical protein [Desulfobacterales bacterium]